MVESLPVLQKVRPSISRLQAEQKGVAGVSEERGISFNRGAAERSSQFTGCSLSEHPGKAPAHSRTKRVCPAVGLAADISCFTAPGHAAEQAPLPLASLLTRTAP